MIDVKICGLTNSDDVMAAQDSGADYIGFVLYSGSPRGISGMDLSRILDKVDLTSKAVGVFVNESREETEKIARDCCLHAVQLHGDESAAEFGEMPTEVWRSVKFSNGVCVPELSQWDAARYVLDAAVPGAYGGTGVTVDWDEAATVALSSEVMLAGGLTPENVAEAVAKVMPAGVDTSSGVEREPGKKDHDKIRKFIEAAKNATTAGR